MKKYNITSIVSRQKPAAPKEQSEIFHNEKLYRLFLEDRTPSGIAKYLTDSGIHTPGGKKNWLAKLEAEKTPTACNGEWSASVVLKILKNETYKGDTKCQKTYNIDCISKKRAKTTESCRSIIVKTHIPP